MLSYRVVRIVVLCGFRGDPTFPRIERVVADLLAKGNVVTPVDVLIGIGLLRPDHLNDWRCGRVPYLEFACPTTRLVACSSLP